MKNSEKILKTIDSIYDEKLIYDILKRKHEELIIKIEQNMVKAYESVPEIGTRCFCIQDLSSIGRGVFLGDFYYDEAGFVANQGDDDAYGYITKWISFEKVDSIYDLVV